ncbi:MAG: alanine racemase [Rickettsiaceae bacterium]|nr:MAG: alanine racemase [Rickettsiaceae bacterium]
MQSASCILEINLSNIQQNYKLLQSMCPSAEVGAIVKANAYGLGLQKVIPVLIKIGCRNFFVANVDEGLAARSVVTSNDNINVYVLNGIFTNDLALFDTENLIPVLNYLEQITIWQDFARYKNKILPCIIHINTGINRLGVGSEEIKQIARTLMLNSSLDVKYIMSHLSASEDHNNCYNKFQLDEFNKCLEYLPTTKASLSNSSGIFLGQEYHFDLVRPGIALYGGNPTPDKPNLMQQVIRLTAPIIQVQRIKAGSQVGYNMTFVTERDTIVATLPIGYADGYPRNLSNLGEVYIDEYKSKIIGRISMDLITIDVTDLPPEKIFVGREVEIIGSHCDIEKIAAITGTIPYEIMTNLSNRYKRIYK